MTASKPMRGSFSLWILATALLLAGSFHEYIGCLLSVGICIGLFVKIRKNQGVFVEKSLLSLAVVGVCAGYGITCLWAVDRGMAVVGFLKFLPLLLYLVCLWQEDGQNDLFSVMPVLGAALAVLSAILMVLPGAEGRFSVADRLAGVFQYPNTFAAFLLVCLLSAMQKEKRAWYDWVSMPILAAGILYTGSRTVFVLAVAACGVMLFLSVQKKGKFLLICLLGAAALTAVLLLLADNPVVGRFFRISLTESTLVGRILYYADGLKLLVKCPFGMGYFGYYYSQGSVQTGVYSVTFIHNDFMQLLLDIGWIPGGLFLFAVGRWFFRKDVAPKQKLVVGTLCLHSLLDFNLQFVAVFMLLLGLMSSAPAKREKWKANAVMTGAVALFAVLSLYMALPLALAHWDQRELSHKLYPYNTQNMLSMIEEERDLERANALADKILQQNTAHFGAYTVKAIYAYSKGNFSAMMQYKEAVFRTNPFDHIAYEEYCQWLINGISIYEKNGDSASAKVCRQQISQTVNRLHQNEKRLSKLGSMIKDQPVTALSDAMQQAVNLALKGGAQ